MTLKQTQQTHPKKIIASKFTQSFLLYIFLSSLNFYETFVYQVGSWGHKGMHGKSSEKISHKSWYHHFNYIFFLHRVLIIAVYLFIFKCSCYVTWYMLWCSRHSKRAFIYCFTANWLKSLKWDSLFSRLEFVWIPD